MIKEIYDYHEAMFRVFPLWGITDNGCECGDPECEAIGKHPRISNWTQVPHWSDEQLDVIYEYQLTTGFGIALDNHLIIDIDPRNGGFESYDKLKADTGIDFENESSFVVTTGGGGLHIYFSRPPLAYASKLDKYKGIDFKSSGYVVGSGSLHKSGSHYEYKKLFPDENLNQCPQALLDLLEKKQHKRTIFEGHQVDVTLDEVAQIVSHIDCFDDYDTWIEVGMAIHSATNGEGFDIWDAWSQKSDKYQDKQTDYKWHSFGKSLNPVTIATLVYHAEQNGYVRPVTFIFTDECAETHEFEPKAGELPFDPSGYDPKRPPGFVGKIAAWMNGNGYFEPLENLTCISSIAAIGNIIGLHTTDDLTNVSTNLLVLCVAGSATGKETVCSSYAEIMKAAGLGGAMAGAIKSKQEICRNLIEHQAVYYLVDEMGEVLRTIENAKKRGGAPYLEGVTGEIMSIVTKASGSYQVSGDTRRELVALLRRELEQCNNKVEKNEDQKGIFARRAKQVEIAIEQVLTVGLFRPFLSMIGYSVPESMDCIMSEEMAKNGFLSRALLAIEEKDNPKPKRGAKGMQKLPEAYATTLRHLASTGSFDTMEGHHRIEFHGDRKKIRTVPEAMNLLEKLREWEWEYAEHHRQTSGFTPLIRRSFELISKISTILAAPEGVRTVEHVEWASVYVKRDLDRKIRHILSSISKDSKDVEVIQTGIESKITNMCDKDDGELRGVLCDKCKRKGVSKEDISNLLDDMVRRKLLTMEVSEYRKRKVERFFSVL